MLEYVDLKYKPKSTELIAEYYLEPNRVSFHQACEHIAGESSIGTWTDISTMNKRIATTLKPHVFDIEKTSKNSGFVKIAYSSDLFEPGNIPQILSSIAGNIYGMKAVKNLRLEDVHFPKRLVDSFKGPKFGIEGIRRLTKVYKRPLVGTIVKPKLGLTEIQHAKVAYNAWAGGLDIVKDDENLTSMSFNKFQKRIKETLNLRDRAEKETGEKKIYMANITAPYNEMFKRAKYIRSLGGEYIMIDILTAGFSGLQSIRNENLGMVMHAHRAMHAALTKNHRHGISMLSIAKFSRLAGVDQLHIGTASVGKMGGSELEAYEIEHEIEDKVMQPEGFPHILEQKWYNLKPVFAVASGGLHPGSLPKLIKAMGVNIIAQFGGGCHGHPQGTYAGAKAIRQAADALMNRESLKIASLKHKELRQAIKKWGIA